MESGGGRERKRERERLTLPSYSRRESTSGAMYAGVPTVDLGFECSNDDCKKEKKRSTLLLFYLIAEVENKGKVMMLLLEVRKWKAIASLKREI